MNNQDSKNEKEISNHIEGLSKGKLPESVVLPKCHKAEKDIKALNLDYEDEIIIQLNSGKYCATFNYSDIGLPCSRTSGRRSDCVWASGWGWVYFNNYDVYCAGSTLTVCYTSRGACG